MLIVVVVKVIFINENRIRETIADEEERFDYRLRAMLDPRGICSRCLGILHRNMDYGDYIEG